MTLLLLIIVLVLNDGKFYATIYRKNIEENLLQTAGKFEDLIQRYDNAITGLSANREIIDTLIGKKEVQESTLYRQLNLSLKENNISPQVHIIYPDKRPLISTGYGDNRFERQHYAIDILLDQQTSTLFHANHFWNNNNLEIVMTAARKINNAGECVGHVYFDMSIDEIDEVLKQGNSGLFDQGTLNNYIICTWYNYTVYTQSPVTDSLIRSDGRYINGDFLEPFKKEQVVFQTETISGIEYCIMGKQIMDGQYVILYAVPSELLKRSNGINVIIVAVMGFCIATFCLMFSLKIYRSVANPISIILKIMAGYADGNHEVRCSFESENEMGLIRDHLNDMIERTNDMISKNEEKQKQLFIAEDNILKAQIKPHFINNLLDSIRWLIEMGEPEAAVSAIKKLSFMLSGRLYSSDTESLGESLDFIRNYIELQKTCYPDRLNVEYDIDPNTLDVQVPSFILQPIVENAIIHGLQVKCNAGNLKISCISEEDNVIVTITDDGDGFDMEPAILLNPDTKGKGLGLYNVHRRLQLEYGSEYGLKIATIKDIGTTVKMVIPRKGGKKS